MRGRENNTSGGTEVQNSHASTGEEKRMAKEDSVRFPIYSSSFFFINKLKKGNLNSPELSPAKPSGLLTDMSCTTEEL